MHYKSQHTRVSPNSALIDPCRELLDMVAHKQIPSQGELMRRATLQQHHNQQKAVDVVRKALANLRG